MRRLVWPTVAAMLLAVPVNARILVVGDSNAIGLNLAAVAAWPMRLSILLDEPVQVYGAPGASLTAPFPLGIGMSTFPTPGSTPVPMLLPGAEFTGDAPSGVKVNQGLSGFRYGILALGTNDGQNDSTTAQLRTAVAAILSAANCPWVCVTPPGKRKEGLRNTEIRNAIKAECLARGASVIDGDVLLPGAAYVQKGDDVHLTSLGHQILARAVADRISPLPK